MVGLTGCGSGAVGALVWDRKGMCEWVAGYWGVGVCQGDVCSGVMSHRR